MSSRHSTVVLALVAAVAVISTACSGGSGRTGITDYAQLTTVGFRTQTVHLTSGAGVQVEDRSFSPGIGDGWFVTQRPDPAVANVGSGRVRDCDKPGCTGIFDIAVVAVGRGTTTVAFQYCYRSAPGPSCKGKEGEPTPAPVVLTVDVS